MSSEAVTHRCSENLVLSIFLEGMQSVGQQLHETRYSVAGNFQ